ncbi:MAG: hypothetical protein DHS20C17_20090 [Cyclobacteriaceae bacterium]|nr:MAG: hypothetical protein DHS20C17_20090 [Cyclobacteriaceae bacterium]
MLFFVVGKSVAQQQEYSIDDIYYIEYKGETGSAFVVLKERKRYMITAKHVLDYPDNGQELNLSISNRSWNWHKYSGLKVYTHPNKEVDVAVIPLMDTADYRVIRSGTSSDLFRDTNWYPGYLLGISRDTKKNEEKSSLAKSEISTAKHSKTHPYFSPAEVMLLWPGNHSADLSADESRIYHTRHSTIS